MVGLRKSTVVVAALCALLLGAPAPATARVTVTVQIAYGAVVVGGVGIFIAVGGAWDLGLAQGDRPTALLEYSDRGLRAGMPIPALTLDADPAEPDRSVPGVRFDVLRWRF